MTQSRSISRALAVLTAMVVVPLLLGFLLLLVRQAEQEKQATKDQLLALARTLSEAVDRELDRGRTEAEVIAASPVMDGNDWRGLHEFGRRIAAQSPGSLFALVDSSGQMLVNTAVPLGQPLPNVWRIGEEHREATWEGKRLPVSSQDLTREVFRSGRTVYSDLFYGVNLQRPELALVTPVVRHGLVRYALALTFPSSLLEQVLTAIPTSFRALVIDRHGLVIASSSNAAAKLADRAIPIAMVAGSSSGHYEMTARDGQAVLGAYAVSPKTGFVVRVSIPRDHTVLLLARAATTDWVMLVLAAIAVSGALATLLGQRLARPLRYLGQVAREGQPPQGPSTGIVEIDALAAALRAGVESEHRRHEEQLRRVTAEQQQTLLRESEARLRRVLDQLFAYVSVLDEQGRVLEVNATPLVLARIGRDDVIGRPFWECWWWQHDPAVAARVRGAVLAALAGQSQRFDVPGRASRDRLATVDLQIAPLRDDEGHVSGVIASGVDVEERVRALRALHEADRQKDEFLATLAHELRNPLAPIRTSVELLRRSALPEGVGRRATDIIERQVEHLTRMVDDLLDVSRITRGMVHLQRETLDLGALAHTTAESLQTQFEGAGIALGVQADPGVLVEGDATRLAQCMVNLLVNALKFTPRGGRVGLGVRRRSSRAVIEVSDNGAGIAAANLERIFDLFMQEQRSGLHGHSGLGIGLALTRKLVELHGGTINASSAGTGQGSTFRIDLPPAREPSAQDAPTPAAQPPARPRRVLVVDDNRDAADCLSELLTMNGFESVVAYDGRSALKLIELRGPDAVLLDIGLPDISGYEVCRHIRTSAPSQPLVIALTGWGQERDRAGTTRAGFDAHLTKPVDLQAVLDTFSTLLAGSNDQGSRAS